MNKLILLSGGAESTAVLMKVISELNPKDNLHVHHINLYDSNDRARAEAFSVKKIIEYCRKRLNAEIKFTSNDYTSFFGKYTNYDLLLVMFIAGDVVRKCYEYNIFKGEEVCIYLGISHHEKRNKDVTTNHEPQNRFLNSPLFLSSVNIFRSHFFDWGEEKCNKIGFRFPILEMNFEEYWSLIPDELKQYICSCRKPQYVGDDFLTCGNCDTCLKLNNLMRIKNESRS